MSLSKKTEIWVRAQLISCEQQTRILDFERTHGNHTFWNVAMGIAGSLIGLGFCLLIAANWDHLPNVVKLIGDFALLGGFFYATYWSLQNKRNGLKEFFAILSFLGIGATIGLVGQIFQLSGGWPKAALFWAVLSLPFVFVSRLTLFNTVWLVLLASSFPLKWLSDFYEAVFKELTLTTVLTLAGMYAVYRGLYRFSRYTEKYTWLPTVLAKLTLAAVYVTVCFIGLNWGISSTGDALISLGAHIIVFGFFALRIFEAVRQQNLTSFKRNAIWAEIYIFLIFSSHLTHLGLSGLGFIGGGLLILFFIWVLRRTSRYIKQMEIFK